MADQTSPAVSTAAAPPAPPPPPIPPERLIAEIAALLAKPAEIKDVALDVAYFRASPGDTGASAAGSAGPRPRELLPDDYVWQTPGADKPSVPLQLCEFLAYRTALAYEPEARIQAYLEKCCSGVSRFAFFDSGRAGASAAGKLADSQGYGFVLEEKAFVIFRGTEKGNDWKINITDSLTDSIGAKGDARHERLKASYGELLDKLGDPKPGRHVGFSIAWAAIKDQVENWLADVLLAGDAHSIIYSGHSLGGALAQVAAFDHARIQSGLAETAGLRRSRIAGVVTFGAPMVGGQAFVKAYHEVLGDRTVLLESSGDLVPRIMQRWYYKLLYPLRQRVKAGVQAHLQQSRTAFPAVATPWRFASEPPFSMGDIDNALSGIKTELEKAAKELAEKQEKLRKEAAEKAERERKAAAETAAAGGAGAGDGGTPAGETGGARPTDAAKPEQKAADAPHWVIWVVFGVVILVVAGVAWFFVRRKLFSHDIEQRYALYLSTLSYQQLRAKHRGDLAGANRELDEHMRFIRGDLAASGAIAAGKPFFKSVQGLPLKIEMRQDPLFVRYLQREDTFV